MCARRGERRGVVIELPMQLCIPGKFGVHARLSEQVYREDGVWDKSAPETERKVLVSTRKPRDEMFLESPDFPLRRVSLMDVRQDQLEFFVHLPHKFL